jgi:DNA modification methylase
MVEVFREVKRVLRDDGTLWLNLGSSYNGSGGAGGDYNAGGLKDGQPKYAGRNVPTYKPKDLVPIPWLVALALQADGWYLRCDIIWHKPNPMPESVTDRPTKSHEYLFLLSKAKTYYYDADAIREPAEYGRRSAVGWRRADAASPHNTKITPENYERVTVSGADPSAGRNKRSVWTVATKPYKPAHFATFPPALIEPCVLAGTSEKGCCPECGAPWEREVESDYSGGSDRTSDGGPPRDDGPLARVRADGSSCSQFDKARMGESQRRTICWHPTCDHFDVDGQYFREDGSVLRSVDVVPCTVLDPFAGSGTTGEVAIKHNRSAVLIELSAEYAELIETRLNNTQRVLL